MSGVIVSDISTENIYTFTFAWNSCGSIKIKQKADQISDRTRNETLSTEKASTKIGHCEGDSSCIKCAMSDDTSSHIVLECVAVASRRLQLGGDYRLENCHGKNALVSGLSDLTSWTDLPKVQWQTGLSTVHQFGRRATGTIWSDPTS